MPLSSPRGAAGFAPASSRGSAPAAPDRGLASLVASLPGLAYRWSNDDPPTPLFMSDGVRELLGCAPERFFGPNALRYGDLIHPDDRAGAREGRRAALAGRRRFDLRYRIRTADGREKWVADRGSGRFDESGALEIIEGFVSDITELKRMETAAGENDSMLALAFSNARDMMLLARVEPGPVFRVQSVNRRYLDVIRAAGFVYTAEQLIGRTFSELQDMYRFPDAIWQEIMRRYRAVVETRQRLDYDEVTETPHGVLYGQSTISPVCDEAGVCRFVLYASSDVTDRKRAEAALRESEEKFAKAFRASPGAMAISEPEGAGYIEINDGFTRLLGYPREEVIGRRPIDMGLWTSLADRTRFFDLLAREGAVRDLEVNYRRRDGSVITCLLSAEWLELGARRCLVTALYDVTDRRRSEAAIRESEEKFAKAFRASPGAMSISEPGGAGFIDVNDGYVQMFGYTREELIGRNLSDFDMWDAEGQAQFMAAFKPTRSVRNLEVVRRRRDGTRITCLLSAEGIELDGRPCVLASLYDITDRKRSENAIRESEEKFAKAFRAVPDAVFITELKSGRVVDVNEGCWRIYGYARDDCIGRTTQELGIWANSEDRRQLFDLLLRNKGAVRDLELSGRRRDGAIVEALVSCETIELDGKPHLVTIAHDITARKRDAQALRESEAKFAKAFHASPGGMGISDLESLRFLEVSEGYARIFGYTREEMIGRTGVELGLWVQEKDRARFYTDLANGTVRNMEMPARRRDGAPVFVVLSAELVELAGRRCVITALFDVTSRRQAELERTALETQLRQAQKLEALGQLAGGIAHDFNNILTGIGAYVELATMDADRPAEARNHLAQVRRATDRATDLVRQILTFSRQTAHERKPLRLHVVIREALKLLRSTIPKTIEIVQRLDTTTPVVLADATQMHQVVMNLCTNAAHAMRARPGRLTVELQTLHVPPAEGRERADLDPGRHARIVVSDTGHGMDAATLGRIFEPFFTTKGPGEGTGLGLPVVHGIIEDHDGVIQVRSQPGEGTTFEICLPEHGALAADDIEAGADLPRGRHERILFVDDEAAISTAMAQLLERMGYVVTACSDPRLAWKTFEEAPMDFDAVFTDLTMPHLTGIELTRRVLERRPGLPVLIATGHSGVWTQDKLRALGARRLVNKPLNAAKLARALRDVLDGVGTEPQAAP